jgi:uracil-DNA glycosylase
VFPPGPQIFAAFDATPFEQVKVVILGQDPYHGRGQAHGLSFSVPPGVPVPPSLLNIYKEIESDLGIPRPDHGCLIPWAQRGVLLLNAVLTVEEGKAGAHQGRGWKASPTTWWMCSTASAKGWCSCSGAPMRSRRAR